MLDHRDIEKAELIAVAFDDDNTKRAHIYRARAFGQPVGYTVSLSGKAFTFIKRRAYHTFAGASECAKKYTGAQSITIL